MLNGRFTGRYDSGSNGTAASGTLSLTGSDMKLQASVTDATFVNGPSLTDLSLSLEKPGSFIIDYDVPKKVLHHLNFDSNIIETYFIF